MKHYYNVKNYARTPEIQELPSLIDIQLKSFEDFLYGGRLLELFDEINPIQSFNGNLSLYFPGNHPQAQEFGLKPYFEEPKYDEEECIERDMSYAAPLYVEVALVNHEQGDEIIRQDIFLGEFPLMTEKGTFIINGTERVVVSQLIRSPGVYFDAEEERATGRLLSNAKLIPDRGAWMEFETRKTDYITIKFNRKRTIPVTVLLRALAAVDDGLPARLSPIETGEDEEILELFAEVDNSETHRYIESCFKNEPVWDVKKKQTLAEVALIEFYRRMRPGDPPTLDNAKEYLEGQLFDQRRYDLERVGRYKLNQRLGHGDAIDLSHRTITKSDIVKLVEQMILINNGQRTRDDIDHLGNRRVKTVGELIGNKLRIGLRRMERVVKERMSIREAEQLTPVSLVNIRPIVAAVREFFGSSQLSQFMEQTNPLSELRHKRTLSALGPGGLRRERAGFDVRDVHHSHYGRICPIETPEGPNIGLIGRLATYARVNELGFIETPYRKVVNSLELKNPQLLGRTVSEDVEAVLSARKGKKITPKFLAQLRKFGLTEVDIQKKRSILGSENAAVASALAGQELARDVEFSSRIAAGDEIDENVLNALRKGGVSEVELRWTPAPKRRSMPIDDGLVGVELGEDVVVASSIHELIQLCRDPDLQATKDAFDTMVTRVKGQYACLDLEIYELRRKNADNAHEIANRFRETFRERISEVDSVLCEHVESRRLIADLLRQLLENPELNQELRRRAQAYLDSLERVFDLREDSKRILTNLGSAIEEYLESELAEVPDNIRRRITQWGKDVVSLPNRFESLRSSLHLVDAELESLGFGVESAEGGRLRQVLSSPTYKMSAERFSEYSTLAAGDYARLDKKVFDLRLQAASNTVEVSSRFIDAFDERYSQAEEVFDAYLRELDPIPPLLSKSNGKDAADAFLLVTNRIREVKIEHLRALDNMRNALDEFLSDTQETIPDNIRSRIGKWGKPLHNFPGHLASISSSLHKETEAIESLGGLDVETMPELILKRGQRLYASAVSTLEKIGRTEVLILETFEETTDTLPVDNHILGKEVANAIDIHQVIIRQGSVLSETDIARLREYAIGTVQIVVPKTEVTPTTQPVDEDLINETLAIDLAEEKLILDVGAEVDVGAIKVLKDWGVREVPIVPYATHDIEYLSADDEDKYIIAQANARLDELSQFLSNRVSARFDQGFLSVPPQRIDYMDIAPRQIVGISAALIPFLSHDAANRALMGSNMQTQAVPLISPDVSVVSTGMESQAAFNSGQVLVSDIEAEVTSVQGHRVIVRTSDGDEKTFQLRKYERSNQSTCIDQRPLVRKGDTIKPGDVIADSSSTYDGLLALGHDVLTCFLSWDGGNYEDALLVSEDMLRADKFTSIHIEKHEIEARDTKLGAEEITYDIPNVGEDALKDLDEHGIVRIGAEVGPNDILVGKITPKGEKELSPEEKLLRAIFGEQAREVKDSSLRLPHGDRGKVIDVKVFTRDEHPDLSAGVEKMVRVSVAQRRKLTVGDKMAGRHGNKGVISKIVTVEDMPYIDGGIPVEIILNPLGVPSRMNIGQILELHLGWAADRLGFRAITPVFDGVKEQEIQAELGRAWMIDWAWKLTTERAWEDHERLAASAGIAPEDFDDDMHVICAYLVDRVSESGRYDNQAIIFERDEIYVRRVAVAEMLREFGHDPETVMVYDNSPLTIEERDKRDASAVDVSVGLWIQQHTTDELELSADLTRRELFEIANRVMFETGIPVPHYGKQTLYDGRTGEPFDRHVAVGYVHMLKLAHLVEDKAHARSTGPYSLVTQQPLGGKAQFGGQRFGEMEVWALEAYGAAHILQEMLTVKSDDVQGRVKTYESIVKGEPIEEPGIPTSFRVLVKELQSLGLSVEAITGSGDVVRFGKYDEQTRKPQPETGLLGLGTG